MNDVIASAKHRLTIGLDREPPSVEPLIADQWVVKSLLQKSIRRGKVEVAQRTPQRSGRGRASGPTMRCRVGSTGCWLRATLCGKRPRGSAKTDRPSLIHRRHLAIL